MLKWAASFAFVALLPFAPFQAPRPSPVPASSGAGGPLFEEVQTLDIAVFDAFNTCDKPGQLQKHGSYFADDVEFYHDDGGVTWNAGADDWPIVRSVDLWQERLGDGSYVALGIRWLPDSQRRRELTAADMPADHARVAIVLYPDGQWSMAIGPVTWPGHRATRSGANADPRIAGRAPESDRRGGERKRPGHPLNDRTRSR